MYLHLNGIIEHVNAPFNHNSQSHANFFGFISEALVLCAALELACIINLTMLGLAVYIAEAAEGINVVLVGHAW